MQFFLSHSQHVKPMFRNLWLYFVLLQVTNVGLFWLLTSERLSKCNDNVSIPRGGRGLIGKWKAIGPLQISTLPQPYSIFIYSISGWEEVGKYHNASFKSLLKVHMYIIKEHYLYFDETHFIMSTTHSIR